MRKILIPLTLVISLISGVLATNLLIRKDDAKVEISKSLTIDDYVIKIESCAGDNFDGTTIFSKTVLECFAMDVFKPIIEAKDFDLLNNVMHQAELKHPTFFLPCHNLMHTVVKFLPKDVYELRKILLAIKKPACQGGLVHGVFDAVSLSNATLEELRSIGDVCENYEEWYQKTNDSTYKSLALYCSDAMGHASYDTTKDLNNAVERCYQVLDLYEQRIPCVEGVMMQRYAPASGEGGLGYERAINELPDFCQSIKSKFSSNEPFLGCHDGAAYVYMRPAHYAQTCFAEGCDSKSIGNRVFEEIKYVYNLCVKYHNDSEQSRCTEKISMQLPEIIYNDETLLKKSCGLFENDKERGICYNFNKERLKRVEKGLA